MILSYKDDRNTCSYISLDWSKYIFYFLLFVWTGNKILDFGEFDVFLRQAKKDVDDYVAMYQEAQDESYQQSFSSYYY